MTASSSIRSSAGSAVGALSTPVAGFSKCHLGNLSELECFAELPVLARAAARSRSVATRTLALFDSAVSEHHADEESELFVAVQQSAVTGHERDTVAVLVKQLTAEHRAIEALWKRVKGNVKLAAVGKPVEIDPAVVRQLVGLYATHAHFEEQKFLPLAQEILGRNGNHLAALEIALHLRHAPQPVGYI